MKIVTLVENTGNDPLFQAEHGLSLYIETGDHKILFDMGQSDTFARNAEKLGVDLSAVDFAVLSHGHYDHGGGLETFLHLNTKAPVYVQEEVFGSYYNGTEKYIGLPDILRHSHRLIRGKGIRQLYPGIRLLDCNDLLWQFDSWGLNSREGDSFFPDAFRHEQYLEITEADKKILLSGCSHKGIVNIAAYFQPDVLIGGFHLNKVEDTALLQHIAKKLSAMHVHYFTGHCTGSRQFACMKQILGDHLESIFTGCSFEV